MKPIYDDIRSLLIKRGWKIDKTITEDSYGVLKEFVHPTSGKRLAWMDAIFAEKSLEIEREKVK